MEQKKQDGFEISDKVKELIKGFTETVGIALEESRKIAFDNLTDYLRDWAFEDFRANTLEASRHIIADIVAGNDHRSSGWATALYPEAARVRDYIWKNYAEAIVQTELKAKDDEIVRLRGIIEAHNRIY